MIADSSFLVGLFLKDDVHHSRAIEVLAKLEENLLIPDRILEETFTVIVYKKGVHYALEVLEKLRKNKNVAMRFLHEEEWAAPLDLAARFGKNLSFADYILIYTASKTNEGVLTFDQQLISLLKRQA